MADPTTWTNVGSPSSATSETVPNLTPGSNYDFRVTASGPGGSATSAVLTVGAGTYVIPTATGTPSVVSVTTNSVNLSWTASNGGTLPINYQVQYRVTGQPTWTPFGNAGVYFSASVTGLAAATSYDFSILASNPGGTAVSPTATASTQAQTIAPSAPTGLTTQSLTTTSITIGWSPSSSGTLPITYQAQYRQTGTTTWTSLGQFSSSTTATASGLNPGTSYDFQVIASGPGGTATSAIFTVQTPVIVAAPSAPTGVTLTAITTSSAAISWTGSISGTRPINYQPQYRLSGTTTWTNFGPLISGFSITITGLASATTYDFDIVATNSVGSTASAIQTAATLATIVPPSSPGPLTAWIITPTSVSLTWPGSTTGSLPILYQPQYRVSGTGAWTSFGSSSQGTAATISGLTPGVDYDFQVVASNSAGTISSPTLSIIAPTSGGPVTTANFHANDVLKAADLDASLDGKLDKTGGPVGPLSIQQAGTGTALPSQLVLSRTAGGASDAPVASGSYTATFRDGPIIPYGAVAMTVILSGDASGVGPAGNFGSISGLMEINALKPTSAGSTGSKHAALFGQTDRNAPAVGVPVNTQLADGYGLRASMNDHSGFASSSSGALIGGEVIATANGLDNVGVRYGMRITYGEATALSSGGTPAEFANGLFIGTGSTTAYAQTILALGGGFSSSAIDLRGAKAAVAKITSSTPTSPVTTLSVDKALPFASAGGLPTSPTNPKTVTINGNVYHVTGVSQTPGLFSGVISFSSPVSVIDATSNATIIPESHGIWLAENGPQPSDIAFNVLGTSRAYADPATGGIILESSAGNAPVTMVKAQSLRLPTGGNAQRPPAPILGDLRANSDVGAYEVYVPSAGTWASVVTSATTGGAPPAAPTALVAGTPTSDGSVPLSWSPPATGTPSFSYQPKYRLTGTSSWNTWGGISSATSTTITSLTPGTRYDFQVVVSNLAGSSISATTSVTIPSVAPAAPTGVTIGSATSTTLPVSWTASASGTAPISYIVNYRVTGTTSFTQASPGAIAGTSLTISGLQPATSYDVQVTASNAGGSASSTVATGSTSSASSVAPGVPTSVAAGSPTAGSLTVTWSAPGTGTTPMTYQVGYRITGQSTWTLFGQPIPATSLVVTGLSAATSYDFEVTATNSAGSGTSSVAVGITAAAAIASSGTVAGSQNSGNTIPVVTGPATGSVVVANVLAVTGITISDPNAAITAGSCTLVMSCTSGTLSSSVAGAQVIGSGTASITYSNSLAACQAAVADLIYTAPVAATSDNINIKFTDQSGANHQISIAVTVTASQTSGSTLRDPALQPFLSTSPYNLGIGSGATWSANTDADNADLIANPMTINAGTLSIPVYIGIASDPLTTLINSDTVWPVPPQRVRVPSNAIPANGDGTTTIGQMVFFDRTQPGFMWTYWGCKRNPDGSITGTAAQVDNVCSDFITHDQAWSGVNAGVGLIRLWELQAGAINHMLRFSLPVQRTKSPGASWDVSIPWPNAHEEFNGPSAYTGNFPFGSTIGIPSSVDLSSLGLSTGGMILGKALQTYGAIQRSTGGASTAGPTFYAEQSAEGNGTLTQMRADTSKLLSHLRVMLNQASGTPNGGGTYPTAIAQLDTTVCPVGGPTGVIPSDSSGELASPAQALLNGFGVNTHIDNPGYQIIGLSTIENCINYLGGIKLIRDAAGSASDSTWWAQVAQACNVNFIAYIGETNASSFPTYMSNVASVPTKYLAALEGCQEADTGALSGFAETLAQAATFQQTVWTTGKTAGLPVIQMSFGQGFSTNPVSGNYGTVGDQSAFATYGNAHFYAASSPMWGHSISNYQAIAKLPTPNKPVAITESGWRQIVQPGYGCVSQATAAAYALEFIFDSFNIGCPYYIWYELLDDVMDAQNSDYGLFSDAGAPKPAATAIKNLFTLLNDSGSNATIFSPGVLNYSLTNLPPVANFLGGYHTLLQKSDGSFWLAIWNEQQLNDTSTGADISVAPVNITLTLGVAAASVTVYDPVSSATAVQSATSVTTLTISLPARPILIKIVK